MVWLNIIFAVIVFLLSLMTIFSVAVQPATIIFLTIGLLGFLIIGIGWQKEQPLTVAAGALVISLLMPTQTGLFAMVGGFICFMLLLSLQLYLIFLADDFHK